MFQCNVCMKKFKTKAHIKYHEFCQNGEKPFKCEQCGQGFIAKSHYEYHLRTHTGMYKLIIKKHT
jgi:KRAB domain-containing zinc finger protein